MKWPFWMKVQLVLIIVQGITIVIQWILYPAPMNAEEIVQKKPNRQHLSGKKLQVLMSILHIKTRK